MCVRTCRWVLVCYREDQSGDIQVQMSGGMWVDGVRYTTHIHKLYVCMFKCLAAVRWPASLICADSFVIGALHDVLGPAAENTPTVWNMGGRRGGVELRVQGLVALVLGTGVLSPSPRRRHHCLGRFTRSRPVHPLKLVKTNWVPVWMDSNGSYKSMTDFQFSAFQTHFKHFHLQFSPIIGARFNVALSSGSGLLPWADPLHTGWTHQTGTILLWMTICLLEISPWLHCVPWNWVSPSADTQQLPPVSYSLPLSTPTLFLYLSGFLKFKLPEESASIWTYSQ